MSNYEVKPIGTICTKEEGTFLKLEAEYIPALTALDGFSHINVFWWFSDFDDTQFRSVLKVEQPYKGAPEEMGVFATRSPVRPNPIALTTVEIIRIDYQSGVTQIDYIDANDNTPLIDIKPYTPSLDRIESPRVPKWCGHWPKSVEESADFAWEKEFNF